MPEIVFVVFGNTVLLLSDSQYVTINAVLTKVTHISRFACVDESAKIKEETCHNINLDFDGLT